ncbi:hypothetical protein, partial [Desulfosarcina sp.]|uniref:hypothetical protein n=1 Tax=Desulfosarcina sp. TaxID=2027861 RepID=UPI0029B65DD6
QVRTQHLRLGGFAALSNTKYNNDREIVQEGVDFGFQVPFYISHIRLILTNYTDVKENGDTFQWRIEQWSIGEMECWSGGEKEME